MTIAKKRTEELLARFPSQRILVVGDLMLDRYIQGTVDRICPEAPVPVVSVTSERSVPGGASNVALNVSVMGGRAVAGGIMGRDPAGEELLSLLRKFNVGTDAAMRFDDVQTTVKTRIVAERQQVVRVDWDHIKPLSGENLRKFLTVLEQEVLESTGVVIEDYGKGVVVQEVMDTVIRTARKKGIPVGFDPKDNRELRMDGVTVVTPNRKEACHGAAMPEPAKGSDALKVMEAVGQVLLKKWRPEKLMLTLGPMGMLLMADNMAPKHVPTRAREVFDVSGAGDTVIASCVLAMAAGADFLEAAELSNYAAGVVVGKLGTATCSPQELLNAVGG